jgi:NAD(P)H dehydrogenase (quinone)
LRSSGDAHTRGCALPPTYKELAVTVKVAVIYYSATGTLYEMAKAVEEGATKAGAEARLVKVPELAPDAVIDTLPGWREHIEATADVPVATLDDLTWADAYAFGTPTRFGNVAAPLKSYLDSAGGLWRAGRLAGKATTGFVSAANKHGGNESTLLALYTTMYHWGSIVVPTGYTDPIVYAAGGNPYGTAHHSYENPLNDLVLGAARYQGQRLAAIAARLVD